MSCTAVWCKSAYESCAVHGNSAVQRTDSHQSKFGSTCPWTGETKRDASSKLCLPLLLSTVQRVTTFGSFAACLHSAACALVLVPSLSVMLYPHHAGIARPANGDKAHHDKGRVNWRQMRI